MGSWGYEIMKGDEPSDRFDKIASIIGLETEMVDDIVMSFNSNSGLAKETNNFLKKNFVVSEVIKKLFKECKDRKDFYGDNWRVEFFETLFFVYALAKKSIPNFRNNSLLCMFNINLLNILEESISFDDHPKRVSAVIDFYNDICGTKISPPNNFKDISFDDFLMKVKDEIFVKNNLVPSGLLEFKECLLRVENKAEWDYPFREEILISIEQRCLDVTINNTISERKVNCKI